MPAVFLTVFEKQLVGSLFGSANPRKDIPKLLELYTQGQLDLDGLVTKTYSLDEINDGYADMYAGKNIRGAQTQISSRPGSGYPDPMCPEPQDG